MPDFPKVSALELLQRVSDESKEGAAISLQLSDEIDAALKANAELGLKPEDVTLALRQLDSLFSAIRDVVSIQPEINEYSGGAPLAEVRLLRQPFNQAAPEPPSGLRLGQTQEVWEAYPANKSAAKVPR